MNKINNGKMLKQSAYVVAIAAFIMFVSYTAIKALSSTFYNDDFPESLAVKVELMPLVFPIHMITGALALLLLPLTFMLRRNKRWHKIAGRITSSVVLISGITAFPVAIIAPVTVWSAAGFSAQASMWLLFLALGIASIRRRRMAAHRACMLMMMATTSGALFFRIYLALWAQFGQMRYFRIFYAFDAWIAWMLPLTICAVFLVRESRANPKSAIPSLAPFG